MTVLVESYRHETGEHCASTALRNLLRHRGTELTESMIFGLASGHGFFYIENDTLSPTRMFHGRTATLEQDFGENTGLDVVERAALAPKKDPASLVSACELVLEGLAAHRRISSNDEIGYARLFPDKRPPHGQGGDPSPGGYGPNLFS